jgi:hypothetical protein
MRNFRNLFWFSVGLLIASLWMAPYAHASDLGTYVQFNSSGDIVGSMSAQSRATVLSTYGVLDKTTGEIVVKGTTGTAVNVAVAAERQVAKAAIAKAAGKIAAKAIPFVGTAIALAEIADLLQPNGYRINAAGDALEYPEQPGIAGDPVGTGYMYTNNSLTKSKTPQASCDLLSDIWWAGQPSYYANWQQVKPTSVTQTGLCTVQIKAKTSGTTQTIYNNTPVAKIADYYVPQYILATEVQTQADIQTRAEQQAAWKPIYDAMMSNAASAGAAWPSEYRPLDSTTPVVIDAPSVTSAPRVVSTGTQTKPDGSVDSTTKTETTTVTPTTTGTNVGDSKTTFPTSVTTVTNVTNNVTNNTSTTTETVNQAPDAAAPPDGPDDPCTNNPNRAGCAELGTPPAPEPIPQQDIPLTYSPVVFASAAGCPAPITYELLGARSISYQPLCDAASTLRPLFLLIASVSAAYIFMDGFKA